MSRRNLKASLFCVVAGYLCFVGLMSGTHSVHADTNSWSQNIYRYIDTLATAPDGTVAASRCNYSTDADSDLNIFSPSGTVVGTDTRSSTEILTACYTNNIITTNGTVVANIYNSTLGTNNYKAVAYSERFDTNGLRAYSDGYVYYDQ